MKTIPITLITGYLGSGKTTLINHILKNKQGYKIAVIVNDIGEVNIDAELIEKGGIVNKREESLVALQNGCICCTLKKDLIDQVIDIVKMNKFDHIMIEASGICEPIPIAQTLTYLHDQLYQTLGQEICTLDAVVSVVDVLRLAKEFGCGDDLTKDDIDDEDIENLIIQQIEFCDVIILNKVDDISKEDLNKVKAVIKKIQPNAKIIETNYSKVDLKQILDTHLFDFEKAITSAGWMEEMDKEEEVENEESGETEEYGIGTFVYYRRKPFDKLKFDDFVGKEFTKNIIRCKGILYFSDDKDMSYVFEQAGPTKTLYENGPWYAKMLKKSEIEMLLKEDSSFKKDWDEVYGDRMIKLVFIGQNLDKKTICEKLDRV